MVTEGVITGTYMLFIIVYMLTLCAWIVSRVVRLEERNRIQENKSGIPAQMFEHVKEIGGILIRIGVASFLIVVIGFQLILFIVALIQELFRS